MGSPRLRNVILVPPSGASSQVYVVSIGNGPFAVRITNRSDGTISVTSYVYARRLPRNLAMKASCEPRTIGLGDFHSTDLMFSYQAVALSGFDAYAATSDRGRSIMMDVVTSTGIPVTLSASPEARLASRLALCSDPSVVIITQSKEFA